MWSAMRFVVLRGMGLELVMGIEHGASGLKSIFKVTPSKIIQRGQSA